jgi:ABC-type transport system involved in multi-copper enzyme maturation permease subunit
VITGSGLIGPEFSTGTLQLIVSKPVRRAVYVVSRVAGVFTSVAVVATAGALGEIITRSFIGGPIPWQRIVVVMASSLTVALLAIATLTFLGSATRAYFNAAIYIGLQAALSMTEAFLGIARFRRGPFGDLVERFNIEEILIGLDDMFFPAAASAGTTSAVARLIATAFVFVALACVAFRKREVPYGTD